MKKYEIKPLVGLIGLLAFAFAVWSIGGNTSMRMMGAIAFVVFTIATICLFSIIVDRMVIVVYVLLIVVSILNSFYACIAFGVILLIYVVGLLLRWVMGGEKEEK